MSHSVAGCGRVEKVTEWGVNGVVASKTSYGIEKCYPLNLFLFFSKF